MKPGDRVTYTPDVGDPEKGILKSFSINPECAFVVYHCNNEWDRYWDYTAASTRIDHLKLGWEENA